MPRNLAIRRSLLCSLLFTSVVRDINGQWLRSDTECYGATTPLCQSGTVEISTSNSNAYITQICLNHGGGLDEINAIESVHWSDGSSYDTVIGDASKAGSTSECTTSLAIGECIDSVWVSYGSRVDALQFYTNFGAAIPSSYTYGGGGSTKLVAQGDANTCLSKLKVRPGNSADNGLSIRQIALYFEITAQPTTATPTTTAPTTAAPTTDEPTGAPTAAPTTAAPTTAAPTTTAPTTATPTTSTTEVTTITTTESEPTHNNSSDSNHTVTVTIRTDSLSSTQVLVAIANAHNLSSTLLTITTLSSEDESEDGFATVELLVAVPSNVELDYDVIEATLREAMVDEYGEHVQVDIDVHGDDDKDDAQSQKTTTAFSWEMWVIAILGSFVACVCCVAAVGLVYVRRQRNKNAVNAPPTQQPAAIEAPPPPPQQIANIPGVSALQVVPGAAAADDSNGDDGDDERKQGEEDVELEMASQEEAKEQPRFVYDENRNYKKEGARASLVTATAGVHQGVVAEEKSENEDNRTPGNTMGATVGNDPNLGVYELKHMVDL